VLQVLQARPRTLKQWMLHPPPTRTLAQQTQQVLVLQAVGTFCGDFEDSGCARKKPVHPAAPRLQHRQHLQHLQRR
jgi:hypothetical protein